MSDRFVVFALLRVFLVQTACLNQFQMHPDQFTVRCLPATVNDLPMQMCIAIGQYGDMLSELSANVFEDRWLTMEQFRRLVERVDAKMYRASQLSPDGP